jgi:superfamily II DNA or RNA helicase
VADRLACVVIDEAHSLITSEHARVLVALGLRRQFRWRPVKDAPPVIGLSATPWRTQSDETRRLVGYFRRRLVRPQRLGLHPIRALQKRGILSSVTARRIRYEGARELWQADPSYQRRYDEFGQIPEDFLGALGMDSVRNGKILARLRSLPSNKKCIVFACSISHAELLAAGLNRLNPANVRRSDNFPDTTERAPCDRE